MLHECVVHVDVHVEVVGGYSLIIIATEHGRYGLSCMQKLCMSNAGMLG